MKMYKVLYICILGLLAGIPGIQAQQRDTLRTMDGRDSLIVERVIVRDTVFLLKEEYEEQLDSTDIIHTRAIGRFDRGIKNYRFIPKGKWIGGLTFSYVNFDSDDSRLLFSILKDFDCNFRTFSVKPFWGYAIRDNLVVGMKLGYNHTIAQLDNVSLAVEDLDVSLKDMRYAEDTYSAAVFHRSYVGLDHGKRFGLFNETTLSYNRGTSSFSRGTGDNLKRTETTLNELHLGINPGLAVFVMQNVCAEVSFGVVGFKYRVEKQKNNLGEAGKRRSSGANFKINLFNINIGITLCM
uniref:hypothetical protein n=1 Tax=Bacteroides finegoldii TaxID=338188 RepID=UPI003568EEDD